MGATCHLCPERLERSEIASHVEKKHFGFAKIKLPYTICCGDCNSRFHEDEAQSILDHCYNSGHSSSEIFTEWQRCILTETKRIQELVAFGLQLLRTSKDEENNAGEPSSIGFSGNIPKNYGSQFDTSSIPRPNALKSEKPAPLRTTTSPEPIEGDNLEERDRDSSCEMETPEDEERYSSSQQDSSALLHKEDLESQEHSSLEETCESSADIEKVPSNPIDQNYDGNTSAARSTRGRKKAHPVHSLYVKNDSGFSCRVEEAGSVCGRKTRSALAGNLLYHIKSRHPMTFARIDSEWKSLKSKSHEPIEKRIKVEQSPDHSPSQDIRQMKEGPNGSEVESQQEGYKRSSGTIKDSVPESSKDDQANTIRRKRGPKKGKRHPIYSLYDKNDSVITCNVMEGGTACGRIIRSGLFGNLTYHIRSRHPMIFARIEVEWKGTKAGGRDTEENVQGNVVHERSIERKSFDSTQNVRTSVDNKDITYEAKSANSKPGPKKGGRHPIHSFYEKRGEGAICRVEKSDSTLCDKVIKKAFWGNLSYHIKSMHPDLFARAQEMWNSRNPEEPVEQ